MQLLKLTIVELLLLPWQIVQTETMLVFLLGVLGNHSFSQALWLLQSVIDFDCLGEIGNLILGKLLYYSKLSLQSNFIFYLQYRLRSPISSFNIGKSVLYGVCFDWDTIDDASPNRSGGAFTHSNHCIVKMDEYQTWTPAYSIFHSRFTSFYRKF